MLSVKPVARVQGIYIIDIPQSTVLADSLIFVKYPELKFMACIMLPDACNIGEVLGLEVSRIIHLLKEENMNSATKINFFSIKFG